MSDRAVSPPPAADYSPPADGGPYASTIYAMYGPAPLAPPPRAATASPPPQPPQAATASPPPQQGVRDAMDIEINGRSVGSIGAVRNPTTGMMDAVIAQETMAALCELTMEQASGAFQTTLTANPHLRQVHFNFILKLF